MEGAIKKKNGYASGKSQQPKTSSFLDQKSKVYYIFSIICDVTEVTNYLMIKSLTSIAQFHTTHFRQILKKRNPVFLPPEVRDSFGLPSLYALGYRQAYSIL